VLFKDIINFYDQIALVIDKAVWNNTGQCHSAHHKSHITEPDPPQWQVGN